MPCWRVHAVSWVARAARRFVTLLVKVATSSWSTSENAWVMAVSFSSSEPQAASALPATMTASISSRERVTHLSIFCFSHSGHPRRACRYVFNSGAVAHTTAGSLYCSSIGACSQPPLFFAFISGCMLGSRGLRCAVTHLCDAHTAS